MREIKFRAWDTNAGTMWTGFELTADKFDYPPLVVKPPVKKLRFMQYTGLKDKNGVEIYEGDIVEWTNNYNKNTGIRKGFIKWDQLGCCFAIFNDLDDDWADNSDWYGAIDNVEVIGNIYENPELLEAKS